MKNCKNHVDCINDRTQKLDLSAVAWVGLILLCLLALLFSGCGNSSLAPNPSEPTPIGDPTVDQGEVMAINSMYIDPGHDTACYWKGDRDSLLVGKSRYVISTRSRYRLASLTIGDSDLVNTRDGITANWIALHDTKADSEVFIFNQCLDKYAPIAIDLPLSSFGDGTQWPYGTITDPVITFRSSVPAFVTVTLHNAGITYPVPSYAVPNGLKVYNDQVYEALPSNKEFSEDSFIRFERL